MDCSRFREHIQRFVDGELPDPLVAEFQSHLSFCGECAAELRDGAVRGPGAGARRAGPPPASPIASWRRRRRCRGRRGWVGSRRLPTRARLPRAAMVSTRTIVCSALALAAVAIGLETRHRRRSREAKA